MEFWNWLGPHDSILARFNKQNFLHQLKYLQMVYKSFIFRLSPDDNILTSFNKQTFFTPSIKMFTYGIKVIYLHRMKPLYTVV